MKHHNKLALSKINELKILPEALEQLVVEYGASSATIVEFFPGRKWYQLD